MALLILSFWVPTAGASGTNYVISAPTGGDCATLGGVYSAGTCTISGTSSSIGPDDTLTVENPVELVITGYGSFTNFGTVTIDSGATLEVDWGSYFHDPGTFYNYGYDTINGNFTVAGEAYNEGGFEVTPEGTLVVNNQGAYYNDDVLYLDPEANLTVGANAFFENTGEIEVDNEYGAYFATATIAGTFLNYGDIYNSGLWYLTGTAYFANGYFDNDYLGYVAIGPNAVFDNYFEVYNGFDYYGEIQNWGTYYNEGDASTVNGYFGQGLFWNGGTMWNYPDSDFEQDSPGSTVANPGTIYVSCLIYYLYVPGAGSLTGNPLTFNDPCAPVIQSATAGPDGVVSVSGDILDSNTLYAEGGFPVAVTVSDYNELLGKKIADVAAVSTNGVGDWNTKTSELPAGVNDLTAVEEDFQGYTSDVSNIYKVTVIDNVKITASCSPSTLEVGTWTTCTATVTDLTTYSTPTLPTGTVTFSTGSAGTFNPTNGQCTLAEVSAGVASCWVKFMPGSGSEGTITLTAAYSGDAYHNANSVTTTVDGTLIPTNTQPSCGAFVVNVPSACTATVTNSPTSDLITPTGTVLFSASGYGSFNTLHCLLTGSGDSASCAVPPQFTPNPGTGGDSVTIGATYLPGLDPDHLTSSGSITVTIAFRASALALVCVAGSVPVQSSTTCTATVTDHTSAGTPITPTGTVSFAPTGTGTFSASSCALSGGSCSVTYTPNAGSEGTTAISATYGGDSSHSGSGPTVFDLTVTKRTTSNALSCSTPYTAKKAVVCTDVLTDNTGSGTPITPSGSVTVTITGPKGYSSTNTCVLSGVAGTASCPVVFTPPRKGTYTLTATYPGTTDLVGSSDTITISVT